MNLQSSLSPKDAAEEEIQISIKPDYKLNEAELIGNTHEAYSSVRLNPGNVKCRELLTFLSFDIDPDILKMRACPSDLGSDGVVTCSRLMLEVEAVESAGLGEKLEEGAEGVFSNDSGLAGLTSIHIPSSVEVICEYCFSNCKSFASVIFDSDTKVSRFEGDVFSGSGLTSIHIPSSVEVICEFCFSDCKSLASVTFDSDTKVLRFDWHAFAWSGLTSIHIHSSVEVICEFCFSDCKSFTSSIFECNDRNLRNSHHAEPSQRSIRRINRSSKKLSASESVISESPADADQVESDLVS
jgi:predicted DsbA family dithiol-disulfide isomerase